MGDIEFKISLIKLVQEHKCLYDKSDGLYYNKINRDNAWKEIATKLQSNVILCRNTWKSLREKYYRKVKNTANGSALGETFQEWPYLKPMAFLKSNIDFYSRTPCCTDRVGAKEKLLQDDNATEVSAPKRARVSNMDGDADTEILNWEYVTEVVDENSMRSKNAALVEELSMHSDIIEEYLEETASNKNEQQKNQRNEFNVLCQKFYQIITKLEKAVGAMSYTNQQTDSVVAQSCDEDALFLQSISCLMKTLPEHIKDEFQSNMYAQVFKLRAEARKNK